jgi:hypothetical protein
VVNGLLELLITPPVEEDHLNGAKETHGLHEFGVAPLPIFSPRLPRQDSEAASQRFLYSDYADGNRVRGQGFEAGP